MVEQSATQVAAKEILFGSVSGIVGKIFEYPFDTLKVRLQSQPSIGRVQYASTVDCVRQTLKSEGYRGFYRGLSVPMLGASFENAILFVSYSKATSFVKEIRGFNPKQELDTTGIMTAGALSGVATSFVLTPIELVKCRLQVQNVSPTPSTIKMTPMSLKPSMEASQLSRHSLHTSASSAGSNQTIFQLIGEIYRTQGLKGFWRGQISTLIRESGGSCCWFSIYELSLRALRPSNTSRKVNTQPDMLIAGALAGVGYNSLFFPFDTVKSRMQTNASSLGFFGVIGEVWKRQGIRGYFKGWPITVARAAPSNALIFWVYESLNRNFM